MKQKIPFNDLLRQSQLIRIQLDEAIQRVIDSGWYILGNESEAFEREFAAYCGVAHAIGLANGSDALEIALRATGVATGDKVITVANAGGYSTIALLSIGAVPVFVDVDPATYLIDLDKLEAKIKSEDIAAVMITHLYGDLVDMDRVAAICEQDSIPVIEDCAQAHGAAGRGGRRAGSSGTVGCFSFYPTKNLGAMGDGGAAITSDAVLAERMRSLRQYGWRGKYNVEINGGKNSRLDEIQAAFLRTKLPYLDTWNERRREIADRYRSSIENKKIICPRQRGADYVAHLFVVQCEDREDLRRCLQAEGIGNDVHYPTPDHRQIAWQEFFGENERLPVTERLANCVLSLPCYPELDDAEVDRIARIVNRW